MTTYHNKTTSSVNVAFLLADVEGNQLVMRAGVLAGDFRRWADFLIGTILRWLHRLPNRTLPSPSGYICRSANHRIASIIKRYQF